ncbi:MAG: pyridoxal phosphate-dependent aminotransferase [Acidimicrobiia bacterium]
MIKRVSQRLSRLPGSATMGVSNRARELAAQGREIISFGAGEPDFPTPEHIVAAAARAAHDPANHHYTSNAGLTPLREAVADYTHSYSGAEAAPSQVLITNGAKQAIFQSFAALIDPGDEVLLPTPYWVTYPAGIELAGGVPIAVPTSLDTGFKVGVTDLEAARTPRTTVLVFVSPSNPTGAVYTPEEARAIGEWAAQHGIWVVADEIYQRLFYEAPVAPSIVGITPMLEDWILVNGVAKSYAMTGWRVGWMVGPEDVVEAAARHQSHATSNVNNIAQQAALAAMTGPQDTVEEMREAFDKRRRMMYEMLSEIAGIVTHEAKGAFYLFPDVTGVLGGRVPTSAALAEAILEDAGVALVPGESFGVPGHLRLSYATSSAEVEQGMTRIAALIESL